ncbi:MAG: non-heme iron oxygenase ferredoxin subunit [Micromonosporaceae bacterium]
MSADQTVEFVKVCAAADIESGSAVRAEIDDLPVAIVHGEDGGFYAIHDVCSHAEVPLSEGDVEDCTIECWLHGSRFDLKTGEPTGLPATEPVPVYPVEVRDGEVYVCLTPKNDMTQ